MPAYELFTASFAFFRSIWALWYIKSAYNSDKTCQKVVNKLAEMVKYNENQVGEGVLQGWESIFIAVFMDIEWIYHEVLS